MQSKKAVCDDDVILISSHRSPLEACFDLLRQRVEGCHQSLCFHRAIRSRGTQNLFHQEGHDGWRSLWYHESASAHELVSTPEDGLMYASPYRANVALHCWHRTDHGALPNSLAPKAAICHRSKSTIILCRLPRTCLQIHISALILKAYRHVLIQSAHFLSLRSPLRRLD